LLKEEGRRAQTELTSLRSQLLHLSSSKSEAEASLATAVSGLNSLKADLSRLISKLVSRKNDYVKKQEHNSCLGKS
jgi:peptidoglycan hydrolase CwlO-like protein